MSETQEVASEQWSDLLLGALDRLSEYLNWSWKLAAGAAGASLVASLMSGSWLPLLVVVPTMGVVWFVREVLLQAEYSNDTRLESDADKAVQLPDPWLLSKAFAIVLAAIALLAILAQFMQPFRWVLGLGFLALLIVSASGALLACQRPIAALRVKFASVSALGLVLAVMAWVLSPGTRPARPIPVQAAVNIHPVFHTPTTGRVSTRPAVKVVVQDDTECFGFDTAELYLSVQSSRFPSDVHVILPINRGEFLGCKSQFVQLPFEVETGDELEFNLIDDNRMTAEQEQMILHACRGAGYCVQWGTAFYCPEFQELTGPAAHLVCNVVERGLVHRFQDSPFRNFGRGTFIVESSRPQFPHQTNEITLLNGNYRRAAVKVYYPESVLAFEPDGSAAGSASPRYD